MLKTLVILYVPLADMHVAIIVFLYKKKPKRNQTRVEILAAVSVFTLVPKSRHNIQVKTFIISWGGG